MKKILYVAQREFLATAGTKAFIFGILVTPLVIGVLILLIPWMSRQDPPADRRQRRGDRPDRPGGRRPRRVPGARAHRRAPP